jgi:2-keto-3-deoxy-L-fuconate dehydrogenase
VPSLTRSIALDYAAHGNRCKAFLHGVIDTPMLRGSVARETDPSATLAHSLARYLAGGFGMVAAVVSTTHYLAGNESGFVSGVELPAD